eukprot:gene35277-43495_t
MGFIRKILIFITGYAWLLLLLGCVMVSVGQSAPVGAQHTKATEGRSLQRSTAGGPGCSWHVPQQPDFTWLARPRPDQRTASRCGTVVAHWAPLSALAQALFVNPPSAPTPLTARRELWLLLTLAGIQFTHILDFMIMMPLGPQFTQLFGISDAQFGLLVSAYTLSAGVSGLLASTYIDRFGRKRLLLVLYALFGLATLACGVAPTYATLMVARVLAGTFGGVQQLDKDNATLPTKDTDF